MKLSPHSLRQSKKSPTVVLIDNFDSFTYNLADYLQQAGAQLQVYRNTVTIRTVVRAQPDLIVYSPGPGNPRQSGNLLNYIQYFSLPQQCLPQFGVCLGLQAMLEAFGGSLRVLRQPMHGQAARIQHNGKTIFKGLPNPLTVGRYHSLVAKVVPAQFTVTARTTTDNLVMAIQHNTLPLAAVQFHPESILTQPTTAGLRLVRNVLETFL